MVASTINNMRHLSCRELQAQPVRTLPLSLTLLLPLAFLCCCLAGEPCCSWWL
jgi:hypothetical protein